MNQPPWPPQSQPWQAPPGYSTPGPGSYQHLPPTPYPLAPSSHPGYEPQAFTAPAPSIATAVTAGTLAVVGSLLPLLMSLNALPYLGFDAALSVTTARGLLLLGAGVALILRTRVGQVTVCLGAAGTMVSFALELFDGLKPDILIYVHVVATLLAGVLALVGPTMRAIAQTNIDRAAAIPGGNRQFSAPNYSPTPQNPAQPYPAQPYSNQQNPLQQNPPHWR